MRPRTSFRFTAAAAVGLLAACSDSTGLDGTARVLGILQMEATGAAVLATTGTPNRDIRWNLPPGERITYPPTVIEAPDTVTVGQPFQVTVYTIGPSGCWSAAGLDLERSGRVVAMTPWDGHSGAQICTTVLALLAHPTSLTLDQTGEWTLRVTGRRVRNGQVDDTVTADRVVFVRAGG